MNSFVALQGLNQEVDADKVVERLQKFFQEISSTSHKDASNLCAIYSTAEMLESMGLSAVSVQIIKKAAFARSKALKCAGSDQSSIDAWVQMQTLAKDEFVK